MILAALAFAAGAARTVFGIHSAQKQGLSERDQIKRAYQISKRRMNESQAYTRQGTNESLNARGILNGGSNTGRSPTVAQAFASGDKATAEKAKLGKAKTVSEWMKGVKDVTATGIGSDEGRMAADAERGQSGDASTLSGQTNSDLSREFYGEHQDLFSQRQAAINASKREQGAGTAAAIGAGIDTAASVYNAGKMIQGAFGAPQPGVQAPTVGSPDYKPVTSPGSWFGGYDPTDPLGLGKKRDTNADFNINTKR